MRWIKTPVHTEWKSVFAQFICNLNISDFIVLFVPGEYFLFLHLKYKREKKNKRKTGIFLFSYLKCTDDEK